jgi:hypothetical protein
LYFWVRHVWADGFFEFSFLSNYFFLKKFTVIQLSNNELTFSFKFDCRFSQEKNGLKQIKMLLARNSEIHKEKIIKKRREKFEHKFYYKELDYN